MDGSDDDTIGQFAAAAMAAAGGGGGDDGGAQAAAPANGGSDEDFDASSDDGGSGSGGDDAPHAANGGGDDDDTVSAAAPAPVSAPALAAPTLHGDSFSETLPLLHAVTREFELRDDVRTIENVAALEAEMRQRYERQQHELKQIVGAYSGKVDKLDGDLAQLEDKVAKNKENIADVGEKQDAAKQRLARLGDELESVEQQLAALAKERSLAEKRVAAAKKNESVQVPKVKHAISLYTNISNIRWDFEASEHARGFITHKNGTTRTFDFDKQSTTQFEIANRIWQMMDTA